jgi:hypothetical protein
MVNRSPGMHGTKFAQAVCFIFRSQSRFECNITHRVHTCDLSAKELVSTISPVRVTIHKTVTSLIAPRIANIYFLALVVFQCEYNLCG